MMTPHTPRTGVLIALILILSAAWQTKPCYAQEEDVIVRLRGYDVVRIGSRTLFISSFKGQREENIYALDSGSTVPWPVLRSEDALRYVGRRPGMWVDPKRVRLKVE